MSTTKLREKQVEAYLVKEARRHGGVAYKFTSPGRRGVPDRILVVPCFDPATQFVEVKRPGGVLESHQKREHDRIRDWGGMVHVVESYDDIDNLFFLMCPHSEHMK